MSTDNYSDNFTNFEQATRLLKIGLPEESADCYIRAIHNGWSEPIVIKGKAPNYKNLNGVAAYLCYPCWSVGQLMKLFNYCVGTAFDRMMIIQNMQLYYILDFAETYTMTFEILNKHHQIDFTRLDINVKLK